MTLFYDFDHVNINLEIIQLFNSDISNTCAAHHLLQNLVNITKIAQKQLIFRICKQIELHESIVGLLSNKEPILFIFSKATDNFQLLGALKFLFLLYFL